MGIQGLLQALKPYVEPVHVSKYSGQRVGIDAYSWLHKGAYGCSWQQLRQDDTRQSGARLPPYVLYCMHRIRMLLYNKITPVVVFDGGRLPFKALTEQARRKGREDNLQKAQQKLAEGDALSAQDHFQRAIEITPAMAHELIKVLRDERVEYVVAPYEADAQLAYLSTLAPEKGGISTIITEDSDLLAYGCKLVLLKMDKFGNGEELGLDKLLHGYLPPGVTGLSFRNFTHDLFLAMCVLAGCDFLSSIPGIGVKKAHALLAKYRNIQRVLNMLKISKHTEFPEDYINNFWQAKAIFQHARVYERKSRSLILLNPLPDELLQQFGGDTEFLGPDLPQSRARAIAIGQLDPTTMRSFDALPSRTASFLAVSTCREAGPDFPQSRVGAIAKGQLDPATNMCSFDALPSSTPSPLPMLKNPEVRFMQTQIEKLSKLPKMELQEPLGISVFEESKARSGLVSTQSLQALLPIATAETSLEPRVSQTSSSGSPPGIDHQSLGDLQLTGSSHLSQLTFVEDTALSQTTGLGTPHHAGMRLDIPSNPFRSQQQVGQTLVDPDIEFEGGSWGLSSGIDVSNALSSVEASQQPFPSSGGVVQTSEVISLQADIVKSEELEVAAAGCKTVRDQRQVKETSARMKLPECSSIAAASQSSNLFDVSVLTDMSPNVTASLSPSHGLRTTARTPSSAPGLEAKDPPPLEIGGKTGPGRSSISRLKQSKSAGHVDRKNSGGKRARESFSQTPSKGSEGNILRFFKPILVTPKQLASEF